MSITPTKEQQDSINKLVDMLDRIDAVMASQVDHRFIDSISEALQNGANILSLDGKVMELATAQYDWAKGAAIEIIMADMREYKQDVLRYKLSGMLASYSARYERAVATIKALSNFNDSMRTLISKEKEMLKSLPNQQ